MSTRVSVFDQALREIAVPALAARGFRFDGSRTFRRLAEHSRVSQIINFQLGQRSMAGKFTVNLGIYVDGDSSGINPSRAQEHDCLFERRRRIGALIPLRFPGLAALPFVGFLFGTRDRWWSFSENPSRTASSLSAAVEQITAHGLDWLNTTIPDDATRAE
ncbi:MAG: DUF4304 domain-containing protein [Lysobacteraceae bacterium]|nr:MAG: DUF4304 domain-containing protein [Xanthomonadaceae bacterium]